MSTKPLGVAVVGAGAFAQSHVDAYEQIESAEVLAIVDLDAKRARQTARRSGGIFATSRLADVLKMSQVALVDICTPNSTHAQIAREVLESGRHVLTEKPIALKLNDADMLNEAARANDVSLTVGLVMRQFPLVRTLRQVIDRGDLGRPLVVALSLQGGLIWPGAWRAWQRNPAVSGGHVLHNGTHLVDLAQWFLSAPPTRVYGQAYRTNSPQSQVDDHWSLTIEFSNGAIATCEYSYSLPGNPDPIVEATIFGDRGVASFSSIDAPALFGSSGSRLVHEMRGDSMVRQLSDVVEVARGALPAQDYAEIRRSLAVCIAGQRSIDEGRPVDLSELEGLR